MRDTVSHPETSGRAVPAAVIGLAALTAVGAAWWLQARGYAPCELCLEERKPYYAAALLSVALALAATAQPSHARLRAGLRAGYAVLALVWIASAALGAYHAGVEWHLWPGPSECSGAMMAPAAVGDFLRQLQTVTVVRCDQAALQVLGLSLAAWNGLLSAALAALAMDGWRRCAA